MYSIKFVCLPKYTRTALYLILILSLCLFLHAYMLNNIVNIVSNVSSALSLRSISKNEGTKYILLWGGYYLIITKNDRNLFSELNCSVNNCIFSNNKRLLGNYANFDAIIFNEGYLTSKKLPKHRINSQIYVFSTIESSYNFPACEPRHDNFFNWTFTYRLDSDIRFNYFVVRNTSGDIVAPDFAPSWQISKKTVSSKIINILGSKKSAAAWLVSRCEADSLRDDYLSNLQTHLYHYSLKIDVYGGCSKVKCPNDNCNEMLLNDYYFYMAFENSFAEDYVTEKVLHGYNNFAVPIVYGGANYSRFLPPGSYINAREIHPYNLASIIHRAVNDPSFYRSFFQWTNLYRVTGFSKTDHPLCNLCAALNSKKAKNAPVIKNFRVWWNSLNGMKWCLPQEFWNETARVNINGEHIFSLY